MRHRNKARGTEPKNSTIKSAFSINFVESIDVETLRGIVMYVNDNHLRRSLCKMLVHFDTAFCILSVPIMSE